MEDVFSTLESALGDIGYFRWWGERFPDVVQLEFSGVQLWTPPPAAGKPPQGMLALAFARPVSVSFLSRDDGVAENWPAELHADRLEPPAMSFDEVAMRDPARAAELLAEARRVDTVFGVPPGEVDWAAAGAMLVFWAGGVGVAVAAEQVHAVTHDGDVPLEQIPGLHDRWWRYWREYWDRKETPAALPHDWMCEVTIPIRGPGEEEEGGSGGEDEWVAG